MTLVPFLGIDIETGPGALIPRAETELLGRTAIAKLETFERIGRKALDVCCGTGNLACAIARAVPDVTFVALDLTDGCVELARANVRRLELADRVAVLQGDLFAPLGEPTGEPAVHLDEQARHA